MLDVSYVRFVTKVSAWNRTIYAAFAAFNLIHKEPGSEGRGEPERPSLPGGPRIKIDQDQYLKGSPYEPVRAYFNRSFVSLVFYRLMKPPLRSRNRLVGS